MMVWLLPAPRHVAGVTLDIHTLFYAALAVVVGFHSMLFWVFTKVYGMREGIVPPDPRFNAVMRLVTLEVGLIAGGLLLLFGLGARHLCAERLGQRGVRRARAGARDAAGHPVGNRDPAGVPDRLRGVLPQRAGDQVRPHPCLRLAAMKPGCRSRLAGR